MTMRDAAARLNATSDAVLHAAPPVDPRAHPALSRLPGMLPLPPGEWVIWDEGSAAQMALRDGLVDTPDAVMTLPGSEAAVVELGEVLRAHLASRAGYALGRSSVVRPDGARVQGSDLAALARLTPMDLCIMEAGPEGHVLTAAALLFPASWTLAEKIGRPLIGIHAPVEPYDDRLARGVQRLFDALRPERPLWRMNALSYGDPALHQPRFEHDRRPKTARRGYTRFERQCLVKLPRSGAVVFTIQTFVTDAPCIP